METSTRSNTRTKADSSDWLKDKRAIAHEVRVALVVDHGHLKARNKEIARKADCSPRTVEAWTDADVPTLPGLEHFLRLVPHSPSIQKMLLQLMSCDPDTDPRAYSTFLELQRMLRR